MMTLKKNKTIGLWRKLQKISPRLALAIIYKAFVKPHFDYDDIICMTKDKITFYQESELFQCNVCLATSGAFRGTSKEKL